MNDIFVKLIDKFPPSYLMLLSTIILAVVLMIIYKFATGDFKVFRDKHGKLLFKTMAQRSEYDRQHGLGQIQKSIDEMKSSLDSQKRELWEAHLGLLKNNFFSLPDPVEKLYDGLRYVALGGNNTVPGQVYNYTVAHKEQYRDMLKLFEHSTEKEKRELYKRVIEKDPRMKLEALFGEDNV